MRRKSGFIEPSQARQTSDTYEGVAVEVALVTARATEDLRQGSRSGEPEDPGQEEPDTVACNGCDHTTNACQEERKVGDGKEERPPSGEEQEAHSAHEAAVFEVRALLVVLAERTDATLLEGARFYVETFSGTHCIVVMCENRGDDCHNEGAEDEDTKRDGMSPADVRRKVDHCDCKLVKCRGGSPNCSWQMGLQAQSDVEQR